MARPDRPTQTPEHRITPPTRAMRNARLQSFTSLANAVRALRHAVDDPRYPSRYTLDTERPESATVSSGINLIPTTPFPALASSIARRAALVGTSPRAASPFVFQPRLATRNSELGTRNPPRSLPGLFQTPLRGQRTDLNRRLFAPQIRIWRGLFRSLQQQRTSPGTISQRPSLLPLPVQRSGNFRAGS